MTREEEFGLYRAIDALKELVESKFDAVAQQLKSVSVLDRDVEHLKIDKVTMEGTLRDHEGRLRAIEATSKEKERQRQEGVQERQSERQEDLRTARLVAAAIIGGIASGVVFLVADVVIRALFG